MTTRLRDCLSRCAASLPVACAAGLAIGVLVPVQAQTVATPSETGTPSARAERRRPFEVELFGVQGLRGEARIPNASSATRFALESLAGGGSDGAGRLEAIWPMGARSELRGQVAPLAGDMLAPAVAFRGQPFALDNDPASRSRLDAWRLTWRYSLLDSPRMAVKVGLTARMLDPRMALSPDAGVIGSAADAGIVPLLHASVEGALANRLSMVADIDALGGSRGGTIDAGVRLRYAIDRDWSASVSYRILNNGTGAPAPYDATRFQYLGVGVRRAF